MFFVHFDRCLENNFIIFCKNREEKRGPTRRCGIPRAKKAPCSGARGRKIAGSDGWLSFCQRPPYKRPAPAGRGWRRRSLKRENALNKAIENTLDNAFAKIQDKRKIAFYLQLIEKADQFPLVMTMLGKWNIENAKPIIINRLEIDRIKTNAIRALGYYKDKSTVPLIEKYVDSEYLGVRKEAKKVLSILL